jgi:hypothetical protein
VWTHRPLHSVQDHGATRCGACARAWAPCSGCGRSAPVRAGTRAQPLCAECAVCDPGIWKTCPGCGTTGRIVAGACSRCRLHRQLHALLADPDGQIRPELQPLHQTLADTNRPITALNWLKRPTVRATLTELARRDRPLTHTALDELAPSKPIEHLRSMLVATAILPARDEHLARIERWVTRTLDEHPRPGDKELLNRYTHWHLLRRLRSRTRSATTTYGQLDVIRQRVRAAISLLDWLHSRELTLASCRQSDLDIWLTSADTNHRAEAGHFVRWAISQRLNRNLHFAATRWTGPAGPLDHEERWHQAKRLLHDESIDTADRVAGLFLLLYAQRLATISRLTIDDIETNSAAIELRFGTVPITMPEPLSRSSPISSPPAAATPSWPPTPLHRGCSPEANPVGRSAPTGSAPACGRSDCAPPKLAPQPFSSSPPNSQPPSWPACSASTSTSPSNGNTTPPQTGPTTQPTSAADQSRWHLTKKCLDRSCYPAGVPQVVTSA